MTTCNSYKSRKDIQYLHGLPLKELVTYKSLSFAFDNKYHLRSTFIQKSPHYVRQMDIVFVLFFYNPPLKPLVAARKRDKHKPGS